MRASSILGPSQKVRPRNPVSSGTKSGPGRQFSFSRNSNLSTFKGRAETCGLFEHEYGVELADDQWKEVANKLETCLRNFYGSDIYDTLKLHPKEEWLEAVRLEKEAKQKAEEAIGIQLRDLQAQLTQGRIIGSYSKLMAKRHPKSFHWQQLSFKWKAKKGRQN